MAFKDGKTYVTVNTDAGFKEGVVTYGIWISCESGRHKYSNRAVNLYQDSTQAELIALSEGIKILTMRHSNVLLSCNILVFNTDSKNAIRILSQPNYKEKSDKYQLMYERFNNRLEDIIKLFPNIRVKFKHVKGHSSNSKGARFYVNNWCDKQARDLRSPEHNLVKFR